MRCVVSVRKKETRLRMWDEFIWLRIESAEELL
jgi:hypothetical protein